MAAKKKGKKGARKPAAAMEVKTRVSQSSVAKLEAKQISDFATAFGVGKALDESARRRAISGSAVSDQFIELAAQAKDAMPNAAALADFDSDVARQAIAFREAQGLVVRAAQQFTQRVEERVLATYGTAGADALDVYAALKVMARNKNAPDAVKNAVKALGKEFVAHREQVKAAKAAKKAEVAQKRAEAKAVKTAVKNAATTAKATGGTPINT